MKRAQVTARKLVPVPSADGSWNLRALTADDIDALGWLGLAAQLAASVNQNAQIAQDSRRLGDSQERWLAGAQARNDALQNQIGGGLTPETYNARLGDYIAAQSAARNHPDMPWPVQMAAPWVNMIVDPIQPRNLPETQGALGIIGRALNGNPLEDIARGLDSLGAADDPEFAARRARAQAEHAAASAPVGYDAPDENIVVNGRPVGLAQRARNLGRRLGESAVSGAQAFERGIRDLNARHPDQQGDIVGLIGAEAADMLHTGPRNYEAHAQERDRARFEGRTEDANRAALAGLGDTAQTAFQMLGPEELGGGLLTAGTRSAANARWLPNVGEVGIRTVPQGERVLRAVRVPENAPAWQPQVASRRLGEPIDARFTPAPSNEGALQAQPAEAPQAAAGLSPEAMAYGGDTANLGRMGVVRIKPDAAKVVGGLALGGLGGAAALASAGDARAQEDSAARDVQDLPGVPGVQVDTSAPLPSYRHAQGQPQPLGGAYMAQEFDDGNRYVIEVDRSDPAHPVQRYLGQLVGRGGDQPNDANYGRSQGAHDPIGSQSDQMDSGEALARSQSSQFQGVQPWEYIAPAAMALIGGGLGRRFGMSRGQPLLYQGVGAAMGAGGAAAAESAMTPNQDSALIGQSVLGGPVLSYGGNVARIGARRLGEAVDSMPRSFIGMGERQQIPAPPVNPPRFPGSLDEGDLDAAIRGRLAQSEGPRLQRARRLGVTMPAEERMAIPDGARNSWPNRLQILGKERLQMTARRIGAATDGTVKQLAQRISDMTRDNPELLGRIRDLWPFLGVTTAGVITGASTPQANAAPAPRARQSVQPALQATP